MLRAKYLSKSNQSPSSYIANAVQQTTDGGYIITGAFAINDSANYSAYLVKTNEAGDTLWTKTYSGVNQNEGLSVQQTDEGYIMSGYASDTLNNLSLYVVKTNSSGDTIWTKTYGGLSNDAGYSIRQTNDGAYILTGGTNSFGAGGEDVYLLKINVNGDTAWTKTYGGSGNEVGHCVRQTSDSGYIVCGYTKSFGAANNEVYLIKTNADGDTLWTKTLWRNKH